VTLTADIIDFNFDLEPWFGMALLLVVAAFAFDIWMLVDAIQRPPVHFSSPDAKTWWIVGLIVGLATALPAFAIAIAYFFIVYRNAPAHAAATAGPAPSPPGASPPPLPSTSSAPANCRSCGAKLAPGARFCHSCGTPVQPEGT
jgi:hypothetical protein